MNKYEQAKTLYLSGMSLTQIAKELKVNRASITKRLNEEGIQTRHEISEEIIEQAKQMKKEGLSISKIADILSLDRKNLAKRLKEPAKVSKGNRKYSLNESVFDVIDTEEKAYWLGFLMADGNVNYVNYTLDIALKLSDKEHLNHLKKFLNATHTIKERTLIVKGKEHKAARLSVNSKILVQDLMKHGCVPNKSLILKFPDIDIKLIHHFMRGYFDGDGSIYARKTGDYEGFTFSVLGTSDFLNKYEEYLDVNPTKRDMCGKAYNMRHSGNRKVRNIFEFLYKDATIYLKRKYDVFCRLQEKFGR